MAQKNPVKNISNFHVQYSELTSQHWHPNSETYAGAHHLTTALERNWDIEKVELVRHWYAGMRSVRIYEFSLSRNDETMLMPVLDNPFVERFIKLEGIELIVDEEEAVQ